MGTINNKAKQLEDIIESIYNSEVSCRIEWMFDAGFTWSIQNKDFPRIWKDDHLQSKDAIIAETETHLLLKNNPLLEIDWIERGCNYSFTEAIMELADAVCRHYPKSVFAKWFNP